MRLLSRNDLLDLVSQPGGPLSIEPFSDDHLQHTSYYLRLGDTFIRPSDGLVDDERHLGANLLTFQPGEYLIVQSHERFALDETVLGIMGGVSDSARQGLALVAGQFIDPLFPGDRGYPAPLEFGLKNMSESVAAIRKHDPIAKISFFDVSDSHGIELDPSSLAARKYGDRITPAVTTLRST